MQKQNQEHLIIIMAMAYISVNIATIGTPRKKKRGETIFMNASESYHLA